MRGRGQCNQSPYQGQYQSNSYQGNNYQGNRGLYHNPHRNFQQGNNMANSEAEAVVMVEVTTVDAGNTNYQYHQYYGHDDEYQTDQYGPLCALCGGYNHSPKHCFKGENDINDIMEKMNISGHQSQSSSLYF